MFLLWMYQYMTGVQDIITQGFFVNNAFALYYLLTDVTDVTIRASSFSLGTRTGAGGTATLA